MVSLELDTRYGARAQGYIPLGYLDGASLRYAMRGGFRGKELFRKGKTSSLQHTLLMTSEE